MRSRQSEDRRVVAKLNVMMKIHTHIHTYMQMGNVCKIQTRTIDYLHAGTSQDRTKLKKLTFF